MTSTRIADLEAGRPAEGVYAVLRKSRRHNRNGDPYLVLELSDSSGRIEGRVWQNAEFFDRNVRPGDQVRVVGRPSLFRDELQLDIRRIDRVDEPLGESFVPASKRDLAELAGELDFLVDELAGSPHHALTQAVWGGAERERLLRSPATVADHHAYLGGLVEHTISVASICLAAADRHEGIDRSLLLAAALLHDVGRAREIEVGEQIAVPEAGALYGHVLLGHELLLEAAGALRPDPRAAEWWSALVHATSTHHGPVDRCRTREAVVLASANALDVRLAAR